jgi:hypothetical protein
MGAGISVGENATIKYLCTGGYACMMKYKWNQISAPSTERHENSQSAVNRPEMRRGEDQDFFGERYYPNKFGVLRLPEGGYGVDLCGRWWFRPRFSNTLGIPSKDVREHGDGTITVSGHLIQGQWQVGGDGHR